MRGAEAAAAPPRGRRLFFDAEQGMLCSEGAARSRVKECCLWRGEGGGVGGVGLPLHQSAQRAAEQSFELSITPGPPRSPPFPAPLRPACPVHNGSTITPCP